MSVPQENSAPISTEPRVVVDVTRSIPGTRRTASSSGRVTAGIIWPAGSSAASAMTLMRGNVTDGKIEDGSRVPVHTPAAQRMARKRKRAPGRSRATRRKCRRVPEASNAVTGVSESARRRAPDPGSGSSPTIAARSGCAGCRCR